MNPTSGKHAHYFISCLIFALDEVRLNDIHLPQRISETVWTLR